MKISMQTKKALFVVGVGGLLALLILPGKGKAPKEAEDKKQEKINAAAALETVRDAIVGGISIEDFELLKQDIQKEYGLRVYYNPKDEKYYVANAKGKDILRS